MQKYSVKKPVFTFRDLEVYQKTMEASVIIAKNVFPVLVKLEKGKRGEGSMPFNLGTGTVQCSMTIPLQIGEAHSIRFGDHSRAILLLENAMAGCNKMIIYLEQARGIYGSKLDFDLVEDLIKKYVESRIKIFRLEKAWQKFMPPVK